LTISKKEENNSQESKDTDYDDKEDSSDEQSEEKQEEETFLSLFYLVTLSLNNSFLSSYLFNCALPNNTEKSLHHIKAVLYFARSVP
jgi:hypothetical protein